MISPVVSVSVLKALNDSNKGNYQDCLLLMITYLLKSEKETQYTLEKLTDSFGNSYGIWLPSSVMTFMVMKLKEKNLIVQTGNTFIINLEALSQSPIEMNIANYETKINNFYNLFINYVNDVFKQRIVPDQAEKICISFFRRYSLETFSSLKYKSVFVDIVTDNDELFFFYHFIVNKLDHDINVRDRFKDFIFGISLAESLFYLDSPLRSSVLKKCSIFLDTRLILRLFGFEGEYHKKSIEYLKENLEAVGNNFYVFDLHFDEVTSALRSRVSNLKHNKTPHPNDTLHQNIIKNGYTISDLELFISQLEYLVNEKNITVRKSPEIKATSMAMNTKKLYEIIVSRYEQTNEKFNEYKQQNTIDRDIKAIEYIYKERGNRLIYRLNDVKSIILTSNSGLVASWLAYSKAEESNLKQIPPIITDVFLGTMVYLSSPIEEAQNYKMNQLMTMALAAVQPDEKLAERFITELDKMKKLNLITEATYDALRIDPVARELLQEKTLGDIDKIDHQTILDIRDALLEEKMSQVRPKIDLADSVIVSVLRLAESLKKFSILTIRISLFAATAILIVLSICNQNIIFYILSSIFTLLSFAGLYNGFIIKPLIEAFGNKVYRYVVSKSLGKKLSEAILNKKE